MSEETGRRSSSRDLDDSSSVAESRNQETRHLFEFGPYRLDPTERKLLRSNQIVELPPKAFDTLVLMVRNSGHLMEKDELIRTLWPDSFVEEGSLSNSIFLLRKALGEDPQYIETVPRLPFRWGGAMSPRWSARASRSGTISGLSTCYCCGCRGGSAALAESRCGGNCRVGFVCPNGGRLVLPVGRA